MSSSKQHLIDLTVDTLERCSSFKHGTSCKTILYRLRKEHGLNIRQWKRIYALVMQTRKYASLLQETLNMLPETLRNSLYSSFRRWFLWLFLYDLLLGKNEIQSVMNQKEVLFSPENIALLRRCLESAQKRIPLTAQPCWQAENIYVYGRVNYVSSSLESVISNLEQSGYRRKRAKRKRGMGSNEFWLDCVVSGLLVFPRHSKIAQHSLVRHQRALVIQDKSSCFVAQGFDAPLGWTIVDACAAPGNKSMHLISRGIEQYGESFYQHPIRVIAIDRDKERFALMHRTIHEHGYDAFIETRNVDFLKWSCDDCQGIILDPSCSGSGLLNRNWTDDLEENLQEKESQRTRLKHLSNFQKKMLRHALCDFANCCRVTYSTCSIYKEENEMVVYEVLNQVQGLGWKLVDFLPQWPRRGWKDPLDSEQAAFCVRTDPKLDHTNGFFVACFERTLHERNIRQSYE